MESSSVTAILVFVGILAILSFFFIRMGNFGFWAVAHKLPNEFMQFAQENDHIWIISNSPESLPKDKYTGPFKFVTYGNIYTLHAIADELESSQAKFLEIYGDSVPKTGFPFVSSLFLLYPISAIATFPTAPVPEALGYGFSNLGYLLFAALIPGKFGVFGMTNRTQILIGGVIFFVIGLVLVNV